MCGHRVLMILTGRWSTHTFKDLCDLTAKIYFAFSLHGGCPSDPLLHAKSSQGARTDGSGASSARESMWN